MDKKFETTAIQENFVEAWLTLADLSVALEKQPSVFLNERTLQKETTSNTPQVVIEIDETIQYQVMEGFGASLTDSAAWLIVTQLPAKQREAVMKKLFDYQTGIGMSFLRQPIGATDITTGNLYSYNELPIGQTDLDLSQFTIEHDEAYIIPAIQQALQINPQLRVLVTPWSPPGWMKTSGSMVGGSLKPEFEDVYANYLVKFIQAYEQRGVSIYGLTIQNEPTFTPLYPGMLMLPAQQSSFIKNYLGPAFQRAKLSTRILIFDHDWERYDYALEVLSDTEARSFVSGTAFHRYNGEPEAQSKVYEAYPDKDIYFTEGSTDVGISFQYMVEKLMIETPRNWAKTVILWNIAYDHNGKPYLDPYGCAICQPMININTETYNWAYNADYYALGHLSKFVRPGAFHIESNVTTVNQSLKQIAFKNTDGSLVLLVLNIGSSNCEFLVSHRNYYFTYHLPAGAAITFKWTER